MEKTTKSLVSRYQVEFKKNETCGVLNDAPMTQYIDSKKVANFCKRLYEQEGAIIGYSEYSFALLLDRANHINGYIKVSEGGLASTIVDIRKIVKAALDANASGVILMHNHPSNSACPSKSDLEETDKLRKALNLFDIALIDNIILAEDEFFSFAEDEKQSY